MKGPDMDIDATRDAILRAVNRQVDEDNLDEADLLDDALTILNRFEGYDVAIIVGSK